MDYIQFIFEIIGTIAFASSGALVAIKEEMDIFGVCALGVTTACGGGMIRDLILGITPPAMFLNPVYTEIAIIVSILIFVIMYFDKKLFEGSIGEIYDHIMFIFDTLGLGLFTVIGVNTAFRMGYREHWFLLLFVGVITGVGGGLLRDVMAQTKPVIFTKHVYALASLAGAFAYIYLRDFNTELNAMILSVTLCCIIRLLAVGFQWNLPRIKD